ncbi:MAG: DUF3108 domain-containing protein [Elusimicrobiaceae bacterium]|nr:DUF3108 domain-containing protein [Elusimicrobiaceae bacterium]
MKSFLFPVLVFAVVCAGCRCKHQPNTAALVQSPAVQELSKSAVSPATPAKNSSEKQPTPVSVSPDNPTAQTSAAAATAVSAPAVAAVQQTKTDTSQKNSSNQAVVPIPDSPVFEDETIISLEGRHLNPLISLMPKPDTDTPSPWKGEQLKYGIYYSFIKAGTAYIRNRGLIEKDGQQAYLFQTTAFSAPVIDAMFKVRDINFSWLDAKRLSSWGYNQSLREGNYQRDEWVIFDYEQNSYHGEVKKKSSPRTFSGSLSGTVLDMLTSLYYVRAQKLTPGQDVVLDIINREEQYPLVVKITGRETIKTPAGKFKCLVAEPLFRGEGIFVSKGKNLKIWLTDDEYKMPVKMKTEVFIGSVSAELLDYKRN